MKIIYIVTVRIPTLRITILDITDLIKVLVNHEGAASLLKSRIKEYERELYIWKVWRDTDRVADPAENAPVPDPTGKMDKWKNPDSILFEKTLIQMRRMRLNKIFFFIRGIILQHN